LNSLYQKFLDTVSDYSAAQASYRQRKKKLLKKQLEITGQEVDDDQLEQMLDENRAVFTQDVLSRKELAESSLMVRGASSSDEAVLYRLGRLVGS
ncbi:syntaxin-1A, partial [Nephila pilipes]